MHPEDLTTLCRYLPEFPGPSFTSFRQFVGGRRFGEFADHQFHLSLLPSPYVGDLTRADIFILALNPGFSLTDYYAEWQVPKFRRRLQRNLHQNFDRVEFPFFFLDPEFCWHGGFAWWEGKLREVASIIASERHGGRYFDALRELSQRIASIELVPYHSVAFHGGRLIRDLASTRQAKDFARTALVKKASSGKASIIITRKVKAWGLPKSGKGVVAYSPRLARSASLGPESPGGKEILRRFGI